MNKEEYKTMKMTKTQNGTSLTIALQGRLDTMTAPELEKVQAFQYLSYCIFLHQI